LSFVLSRSSRKSLTTHSSGRLRRRLTQALGEGHFVRKACFLVIIGLAWGSRAHSADAATLSESQAHAILAAEMQRGVLADYVGVQIEFDSGAQLFGDDFYSYSAQNDHDGHIDVIGYFAINKRTGAIWDAWACNPIHPKFDTPVVKRTRNSLGKSAFLKLDKERPVCFND
jgi:hypothetical protein